MNREIKYTKTFFICYLVGLTLLFGVSFLWNMQKNKDAAIEFARIEGQASFEKDLVYRSWAAMHGGVYAPITKETQPNPHLDKIPNRDITIGDKKLTLINPAYMTRQVHELGREKYGVKGHITSLNPIRPENKPDDWELNVLKQFEKGIEDYSSIEQIDDNKHLRYMKPLITQVSCLKCHAHQGYKTGDIRGGISVSVPMKKYDDVSNAQTKDLAFNHSLIYLILVLLGSFSYKKFMKELHKRNKMHQKIKNNEELLQLQNAEYMRLNQMYKQQNAELQIAKEKAEESDRMKTAFLQNMSHEIRTPMNAIVGFSDLLATDDLTPDKQKKFTTIIQNSSNQLLSIVNDILTISALETNKEKVNPEKVNINGLIDEQLSIFKFKAEEKNIQLLGKCGLPDDQSEIYTDKTKLTQILTNLVSNAFKFTEQGAIEIGYKKRNNYLEFYVKDSGIGIEEIAHKIVFDRFKQAHETITKKYGGTGLGLSISKALTELLGGFMRLESEPGKGTTFYFTIPCSAELKDNIKELLTLKI